MIDDILKLRRKGLSFRKIAKELDSTVGKVQYQWTKYKKKQKLEKGTMETSKDGNKDCISIRNKHLSKSLSFISNDEILACLISTNKVFVHWKISSLKDYLFKFFYNRDFNSMKKALRIYDITCIIFNGKNAHQFQEIILPPNQQNWILKGMKPNRSYCIEFGIKISEHEFLPLLRSNAIHIPRNSVNQAGSLKKEIDQFINNNQSAPNWIEHVSTYSLYEKENHGRD